MKKIAILILLVAGFLYAKNSINDDSVCEIIFESGAVLQNIEVAFSPEKKAIGLANKEVIERGMIFVFEKEEFLHFWMKGTLADISIGYIGANLELFQIIEMKKATLDIHSSKQKAKYALELEKFGFEKRNIKVGDKIKNFTCKNR